MVNVLPGVSLGAGSAARPLYANNDAASSPRQTMQDVMYYSLTWKGRRLLAEASWSGRLGSICLRILNVADSTPGGSRRKSQQCAGVLLAVAHVIFLCLAVRAAD